MKYLVLTALCLICAGCSASQLVHTADAAPRQTPRASPTPDTSALLDGNCGPWDTDNMNLKPVLSKWLRGERLDEEAYCSNTAIKATAFNPTNVHPKYVDLNDDGRDELTLQYLCSPTGNCKMNIYQKVGESHRQIFAGEMVQTFEKLKTVNGGFRDLQTRSHGSCCDGDQVVYRFKDKAYQAMSCAGYSYLDDNGNRLDRVKLSPYPCRQRKSDHNDR